MSIFKGYNAAIQNTTTQYSGLQAEQYIDNINSAIDTFNKDINDFNGFSTDVGQLKGDIFEFGHSDTFNIFAVLNDSKFQTVVDRSHVFASADITSNWGDRFGLKNLRNAQASANAQATSYFERYCKYKATTGRTDLTFEDFLREKKIDPDDVLKYESVYNGQIRIIPKDQLEEAIAYLKIKIAKEAENRPEQVARLQETLNKLETKIKAPDGTQSEEFTKEETEEIARLAKEGKFNAREFGFTTEELVKIEHILRQGVKAGLTAAVISFVLKTAPKVYDCLTQLLEDGEIDEDNFRDLGFSALSGSSEGFLRGFIAASLTTACESGVWGETMKNISPGVIAGLTVIMINMMKDSYFVAIGKMSKQELAANITRNIFVTSLALGLGSLTQIFLPLIPGAYLIGNFVGSIAGSFLYNTMDNAFMALCVESGWTMFGLVEQDYELPDEVIKELGFDIYEVNEFNVDESDFDEFTLDEFNIDEYDGDFITILRRGVIGVHRIGYIL